MWPPDIYYYLISRTFPSFWRTLNDWLFQNRLMERMALRHYLGKIIGHYVESRSFDKKLVDDLKQNKKKLLEIYKQNLLPKSKVFFRPYSFNAREHQTIANILSVHLQKILKRK